MSDPTSRPIRYVVFHQPGSRWLIYEVRPWLTAMEHK